ncbi:MAG: PLP-dependent cysteine synthase family protein [Acidobacteriota bacterium]
MNNARSVMELSGSILQTIGRTPVVRLQRMVPANAADVLVKLEYHNPTGSYKDRMALAMIEGAERRGALEPGMRVLEFTGGSTGNSLAFVCAVKGYRFTVVTNDAVAIEKRLAMRAFGAEVIEIKSEGGKLTPDLVGRMREVTAKLAAEPGTYFTDQFNNLDALDGYRQIATELLEQTGGKVDVYCGCVGTGGMIRGVGRGFSEAGCRPKVVALEPLESAPMSGGTPGPHTVEGVAPGFIPPHMKEKPYSEVRAIPEQQGREIARRLAREEGIFAGTSSGLNVAAAIQLAQEFGPGHTVATVAVDTGNKYLAGDLYR